MSGVLSYADEIFSLGSELEENLRNRSPDRLRSFNAGIADVVPKTIALCIYTISA